MLRFWGFEMVDGETLGTYSLLRPISRPLDLSTSYSQAKKANLFFERYLAGHEPLARSFLDRMAFRCF